LQIESLSAKKDNFEQELKKLKGEKQKFAKEKKEELEKLRQDIIDVKNDKKKKFELLQKEL